MARYHETNGLEQYAPGCRSSHMIIYKVLWKNYELKQGEFLGALPERRKDLRRRGTVQSALKWARLMFGQMARDKQAIFVVPHELNLKDNPIMPGEKAGLPERAGLSIPPQIDYRTKRVG
jgi:hypothetical protein